MKTGKNIYVRICTYSHISKFFDIVDKLEGMDVKVNNDLLAIILLYSLLSELENLRCAVEFHHTVGTCTCNGIKIIAEGYVRCNATRVQNAIKANKYFNKSLYAPKLDTQPRNVKKTEEKD